MRHHAQGVARELVRRLRALPHRFAGTEAVRRGFRDMWALIDSAEPCDRALRSLRLRQCAYGLLLALLDASARPPGPDADIRIQQLIDEMAVAPGRAYPIPDLARRASLNAVQLHRRFKRITGLSPHAFLTSFRMQRARELLASTRLPVSAIALRLGYPSAQHFATRFKSLSGGLTPRDVRHAAVCPKPAGR